MAWQERETLERARRRGYGRVFAREPCRVLPSMLTPASREWPPREPPSRCTRCRAADASREMRRRPRRHRDSARRNATTLMPRSTKMSDRPLSSSTQRSQVHLAVRNQALAQESFAQSVDRFSAGVAGTVEVVQWSENRRDRSNRRTRRDCLYPKAKALFSSATWPSVLSGRSVLRTGFFCSCPADRAYRAIQGTESVGRSGAPNGI